MKQTSFKTQKNGNLDFTNLGFGGVPIGNLYRELTDEEAYATVRAAWDNGIPGGQTPDEVRRNIETLEKPISAGLWAELKEKGLMRSDAPVPDTSNI